MLSAYKLLIFLVALWLSQSVNFLNKVIVNDSLAVCLDGSPAAYYIHPGDKTRFILHFEGGGWCGDSRGVSQTLESCYQRSKTTLGSSLQYPSNISFSDGILSDSPASIFKGRTLVYLKYCTGTGHQGFKWDPIDYKSQKLYFRGHYATIGQLNSIDKLYNLFNASEIIVSGQSAGGLAAMIWVNYIASRALNKTKVLCLADSGIFLDQENMITRKNDFKQSFLNFMQIANLDMDPPTAECVRENPNQKYKCLFAQYLYQYIKVPFFPAQSLYDPISLQIILGIKCQSGGSLASCSWAERDYIQHYKRNTTDLMMKIHQFNVKNGGWGIACAKHVFTLGNEFNSSNYVVPAGGTLTLANSIFLWQNSLRTGNYYDSVSWPDNAPCSGVKLSTEQ